MSELGFTTEGVRWACACCWNPFTPNNEQVALLLTIKLPLCVPCIAAVDAEFARLNKLKEAEEQGE